MHEATFTVDPAFRVGDVDPRLYGSFVEHMGRCVYDGIYEPGHPNADEHGFRTDVADLVRQLSVPIIRYPGGNFVSGYTWEDGTGPVAERPTRLDLAWRTVETNEVGLEEFSRWARSVGAETMLAVNLGTRGIDAARNLVEYCNHPSGSQWSDLRRANGAPAPYGVRVWCLGNEMDGPWQIGHKTAYEYGRLAAEAGKVMKLVDPTIELVACGSSHHSMPTFGNWEVTVLNETYGVADYISMHAYYEQLEDDRDSFLASSADLDNFIHEVVCTADHVRAVGRHKKHLNISLDEWNVWYQHKFVSDQNLDRKVRLVEDIYTVTDAVVVGSLLISMLRHADRVKVGCFAQLVNMIAPIMTEPGGPAWPQATYHPIALTSRHARGTVLRVEPAGPTHETARHGEVPLLDAVAVLDEEPRSLVVLAVNRDRHERLAMDVDLRSMPDLATGEHTTLCDEDPDAVNDAEHQDRVRPRRLDDVKVDSGRAQIVLPPLSWNLIRLSPAP